MPVELFVSDVDERRINSLGLSDDHWSTNPRTLFSKIDAAVVVTPAPAHFAICCELLEMRKDVFVEKPMAMDVREAEKMLDASAKSGAILMVAHCWRFDEDVNWLKAQSARLGKIIRTKGYGVHSNWGPAGWFTQKALAGGGALADMGIHALDTARYLLGDPKPVSVYAKIGTHYKNFDVDDTGVIIVEWDNGTTSYTETGWWQPHSDSPEAGAQLYGVNTVWQPEFLKEDWRHAARLVEAESGPNDVALVYLYYYRDAFRYYFKGAAPVVGPTTCASRR